MYNVIIQMKTLSQPSKAKQYVGTCILLFFNKSILNCTQEYFNIIYILQYITLHYYLFTHTVICVLKIVCTTNIDRKLNISIISESIQNPYIENIFGPLTFTVETRNPECYIILYIFGFQTLGASIDVCYDKNGCSWMNPSCEESCFYHN